MSRTARILAAAGAAALLAACGGGGSTKSTVPQTPAQNQAPAPATASTSFKYLQGVLKRSTSTGPVQLGTMRVDVQMQLRSATALQQYAASVGDPQSGLYRHFLTPDEIGQRFGASDADWNAAIAYFKAAGLQVTGWKQKSVLRVVGPQPAMEKAFGTTFASYKGPGNADLYGPATTPHFSKPLAVHSVTNLVYSPSWMKRNSIAVPPHGAGPSFNYGVPPQQLAAAFDYAGAYAAGFTGRQINIGVIGTGPISPADYATLKQIVGLSNTNTITQVNVGTAAASEVGGSPTATPPPVTAPCSGTLPACNPEDIEAQIDTEQTASLAPSANVLFYLAYVPQECFDPNYPQSGNCGPHEKNYGPLIGINEVNDEVQQAINDNQADVISISYGIAEQYSDYTGQDETTYDPNGTEPVQFAMLQSEGIAVFVSSGDAGAQGCARPYYGTGPGVSSPDQPCVSAPAVDQNVTSVGGITAPLDESGRKIGPYTTWGVQTERGFGATGGGLSIAVPRPSWQTGPGVTGSFRNQPDASLDADPVTGVAVVYNAAFSGYGGIGAAGGTSVAAPEMAAMWALVLDACRATTSCTAKGSGTNPYRLGNAAPYFYKIYNDATLYPNTFLDIVDGSNGVRPCSVNPGSGTGYVPPCPNPSPTPDPGYKAGQGYDLTTGIGVPFGRHLIKAVVGV
ncbi:MAG TPA: protease pro-enzyme activation domain-containing protein [Candidatus Elarobacter sp.]|jgi:subtilase family serine protease|nr:protease pro-enzyme activation domain-containing protein [Candidatus Elarobacter sp.]